MPKISFFKTGPRLVQLTYRISQGPPTSSAPPDATQHHYVGPAVGELAGGVNTAGGGVALGHGNKDSMTSLGNVPVDLDTQVNLHQVTA